MAAILLSSGRGRRRMAGLLVAACFAAFAGSVGTAWAQAAASAGFHVRIIEGAKGPAAKVDAKLQDLRRELETLHHEYNSFALVSEHSVRLNVGQRNAIRLPDGGELAISLLEIVAGPPQRIKHQFELAKSRTVRSVSPGGRTIDVRPWAEKLVIICTSVDK